MTNQRSAMVMAFFCLIAMFFFIIFYKKDIIVPFLFILIIVIVIVYPLLLSDYYDFFITWSERLDNVGDAVGERDSQWISVLLNSQNLITGTGLGSVGHHSLDYGKYHVPDGGLIKYLAEFGVVGMSIFISIIIVSIMKGVNHLKYLYRELLVIVVCIAQSIGSNILSFQHVVPMFWFCVGVIASYKKKKDYKKHIYYC